MLNFIKLIQNENMKIYRRVGTYVMMGLFLLIILTTGVIEKYIIVDSPKTLTDFMITTTNLVPVITLFTIIVAAGSVASEFSWGTIKLLLIRPVSRSKILLVKYISIIGFAFLMLFVLFLSSFIIGGILFGFNGNALDIKQVAQIWSIYGLNSVELIMMATFAFMISSVFQNNALAIGLSIFLMFTGPQIVQLLSQYNWVKYLLFANTNLAMYKNGVPLIEGMTLEFSIIILFFYFIIFNTFSWVTFNKKDIAV